MDDSVSGFHARLWDQFEIFADSIARNAADTASGANQDLCAVLLPDSLEGRQLLVYVMDGASESYRPREWARAVLHYLVARDGDWYKNAAETFDLWEDRYYRDVLSARPNYQQQGTRKGQHTTFIEAIVHADGTLDTRSRGDSVSFIFDAQFRLLSQLPSVFDPTGPTPPMISRVWDQDHIASRITKDPSYFECSRLQAGLWTWCILATDSIAAYVQASLNHPLELERMFLALRSTGARRHLWRLVNEGSLREDDLSFVLIHNRLGGGV